MVGHGEFQHACGALLLGQFQTGAAPALEHADLGVRVCDSLELCAHRHSLQVGNIAAILQENLCAQYIELMGLGFGIGIRRRDLVINRGDLHIVCGHREGDLLAADIHRISGQTLLDLPVAEGHALRLPCDKSDFLTNSTLFWLPVHGQGVGVLLVLRFQRDVVCRHLEGNSCLGGVRTLGHAIYLPTGEGVTVLLGCGNRDVLIKDTRFVHAVHGQGVGVLLVLRFQRDVVCRHLEGDGRLSGVHISRQTSHFPTGEGVTVLLGCGGNELCTRTHSRQVGNIAAILQGDRCIGDIEFIGLGSVLGVLCLQRDVVCGHLEGDGRLSCVHISGQTGHFPTGEGATVLLRCSNRDVLIKDTLFWLPVHGQGVGVLLVLRFQRDVVCRHLEGNSRLGGVRTLGHAIYLPTSEGLAHLLRCGNRDVLIKDTRFVHAIHGQGVGDRLIDALQADVVCGHGEPDLDMRAGIGDGIRILCQSFDRPDNVIAFPLFSAKGDLIAHVLLHAFLTIPVVLRLGRLGHSIGAYLIGLVAHIVFKIVSIFRHLDVHIVAAGGGGNRLALVGAVQQGHLRVGIVVICAGVFHLVLGGIVGKVLSLGRVADRILTYNNRTGLVLFAFLCNDGSLIAAIRIRYLVDKDLALVYTGNALELKCALANAFWAGQREGAILVVVGIKVIQRKALKGQLFSHGVAIRQLVIAAIVVSAILHHKPDVVGTHLGGHSCRSSRQVICSAVLKGSLRDRIAEILRAGIGCGTVLEVKAEVRACRLVRPCTLIDLKFTALVQRALFGTDVHLIAAVLILRREVVKLLVVVGAHKDHTQFAHTILFAGNARDERAPVDDKVLLGQGRERQLFAVCDSIGAHFVLGAIVVVTIIHHDVDRVGTCLGRLRHRRGRAILRDILDGIMRGIVKIHRAGIVCSLGLGVIRKVGSFRLISAYHLADLKRAFCVLVALFRDDALLVDAI